MRREDHKVDRAEFPPGPWDAEPMDRWEGEIDGVPVLAVRNNSGAWCGYVALAGEISEQLIDELGELSHGGITYGPEHCQKLGPICHTPRPGQPDNVQWIGFDCAHVGDDVPALRRAERMAGLTPPWGRDVYRDLLYVKTVLARMVGAAKGSGSAGAKPEG